MKKIIVTTGQPFTDIDALACAISYAGLLKFEGKDAEAVLPGPLNKSITKDIKGWDLKYLKKTKSEGSNYVLVDISNPKYFASFVKEQDVVEIFDHRSGFENHWIKRLGKNSHIEMVGACATLIWEEFERRYQKNRISTTSANLLATAIVSNTLNFNAGVTTERDKIAYKESHKLTNLPEKWIEKYFEDQEREVYKYPIKAILSDTKGGKDFEYTIGQLELWNSRNFLITHLKEIEKALMSFGNDNWFLTSPSISEGINYLFAKNSRVKKLLETTVNAKFDGDIGTTNKLWLRKEILQKIQKS